MNQKVRVLIFRDVLMPYSETFIPSQVEAFQRYEGYYVGTEALNGLPLPEERKLVLFKQSGWRLKFLRFLKLVGIFPGSAIEQVKALNGALLHAHFGFDAVIALPLVRRLGLPLIVSFHGYDLSIFTQNESLRSYFRDAGLRGLMVYLHARWVTRLYPDLFRTARAVIVTSQDNREILESLGCPPEKLHLNYLGVNEKLFQPDPAVKRQTEVLYVGRLVEKKGLEILIRAMAVVQKTHPEYRLTVIGDGPLRERSERLAAELLSSTIFLGRTDHEGVRARLNQAMICCLPSLKAKSGDREGMPLAIKEAMAMGAAVVSTRHAGIIEAIHEEQDGLLVDEGDWHALAEAILRLIEEPDLPARLVAAARQVAETKFSLYRNVEEVEQIYDEILDLNKPQ